MYSLVTIALFYVGIGTVLIFLRTDVSNTESRSSHVKCSLQIKSKMVSKFKFC